MMDILLNPIRLKFETSFRMGTGFSQPGLKALARRAQDGSPILPAAGLKGALRELAERLCADVTGSRACVTPFDQCAGEPCPVCRLFGNPAHPGRLIFTDGTLATDTQGPLTATEHRLLRGVRRNVSIDRRLGTASPGLFRATEVIPAGLVFEFTIRGKLENDIEGELLKTALLTLRRLGAETSRGLGRCAVTRIEGTIGGAPWSFSRIENAVTEACHE